MKRPRGARPKPARGWQGHDPGFVNPRAPSVTASVAQQLSLDDYFAAAALMGLLASQSREPDQQWAANWSLQMGTRLARVVRKRRLKRKAK